jgi:TolA-binding protein
LSFEFSGVDKPQDKNDLYGLRYDNFVIPLVKAVQELSKMNDEKDARIDDLQKQIDELRSVIITGQQQAQTNNQQVSLSSPLGAGVSSLEQNVPNPFGNTTIICYTLPQKFSNAQVIITDTHGKVLKQLNISHGGKGTISMDAASLSSGAYNYSLIVDGKIINTKQMILAK